MPPSIPAEYLDPKKFGHIAAWGYATVIKSNVPEIETGSQVFRLLPIGNLPLNIQVKVNPQIPSQFFKVSKHWENVMPLYNQYQFSLSVAQRTIKLKQSQAYDALFQVFFTTSYLLNRFTLPWDTAEFVHPGTVKDGWTVEKGSINDKTTVLIFADSGKTALALAYLLKSRLTEAKPGLIVRIGSSASRAFIRGTGLYDQLLTYDSDSGDLDAKLSLTSDSKVVVVEFGSRGDARTSKTLF